MAKNKPNSKLKELSGKDLKNRKTGINKDIKDLKEQRAAADTKKEKKAISKEIDNKSQRLDKANSILDKRKDTRAYAKPNTEELLQKIYSSDEFLNLSPANQQLLKETAESYDVSQLQDINLSKKEINNLYRDAKKATKKEFKQNKKQFDQDYEEALRQDVIGLEQGLEQQKIALESDKTLTADQKAMAIRDLQDALEEAKTQYGVAAERKNLWLQNKLEDLQVELDKSVGRADEDKIIELRQLERKYNTNLTDVQTNMAQRGLAFSGIRAKAESDLQDEYEDYMTTAELEAERKKADAERLAFEQERDSRLYTQQELDDLVTQYTGVQKEAVQGAEALIGSEGVSAAIGAGGFDINGNPVKAYKYNGITGSLNAQENQSQSLYQGNMNKYYADFERQYGTKALKNAFGDSAIGATDTYAGYTPVGKVKGTDTTQLKRDKAENRKYRRGQIEQAVQTGKDKLFISKI